MSTDHMTPEQIEAIRARANAATPGPWERVGLCEDPGDEGWWIHNGRVGTEEYAVGLTVSYNPRAEADAEFIAHARADIPQLLDRIAELDTTCTCQAWPPEGPSPECAIHGAIRALNEATRRITELEAERDEARREVFTLRNSDSLEAVTAEAKGRQWAINALRDRERMRTWLAAQPDGVTLTTTNGCADYLEHLAANTTQDTP